jgi:DeoR family myo-inositol catabolism operon transcriptional repressor
MKLFQNTARKEVKVMKKNEREREIINLLKQRDGFVSTSELCRALYSSESSIRRDLSSLESKGIIKRNYGGCELNLNRSGAIAFSGRAGHNVEAKRAIAKEAAKLLNGGEVVFLDQSSTAYYLAEAIREKTGITVVTNNTEILALLSSSAMRVICCGGYLCEGNRSCLVGAEAERGFSLVYADILFFSAKSLSNDGVITDCAPEEIGVRAAMIKNASKRILLCDSEKLGTRSAYKQCELSEVDYIICEKEVSAELLSKLRK